jgi:hypothetical protein
VSSAKACSVKLGGPKLARPKSAMWPNADHHAANVLPVIREIQRSGASLHQIADALNARGIGTPRGGPLVCKVSQRRACALLVTANLSEIVRYSPLVPRCGYLLSVRKRDTKVSLEKPG